jgi:cysteinyl-tRNA synthetase
MKHKLVCVLFLLLLATTACNLQGYSNSDEGIIPEQGISSSEKGNEQEMEDEPSLEKPKNSQLALDEVSHWFYYLDVNLEDETTNKIMASSYDMVVIDYIASEEYNTDYPLSALIESMHNADHPKLVIAYIDIGQAEDFRTYWQPDWEIGDPEWIIALDPDGWEGNYPVAYWWDEYQEIWLGEDGYLQGILDSGFDGIYLDWIEAYSDENVIAFAREDGVDPVKEMIWWVEDIADYTRAQNPDFIVIAQNAAELAQYDEYVHIIDAIAQEQVWFDGGADNVPPGDCPLPATNDDIDADDYYNSLSHECQQQYDEYPESTLHISSEEYIDYLIAAQGKGLVIFTVDYATDAENIDFVYRTSRALDFVPFASTRFLDQYVEPVP